MMVEWVYLTFQVGVSKYNAIYGGFAALPLFLAWVQTNWLVMLLGAELSFAFQNQGKYEFEIESIEISASYRFALSVAVIHSLIQRFKEGEKGPSAEEISEGMHIPAKLVRRIINELVNCRIISEVVGENREASRYLPAIDIARLDINFVWRKLNDHGINEIPVEKNDKLVSIEETIKKFQQEIAKSSHNLLIKDI
jgi:membrane protein